MSNTLKDAYISFNKKKYSEVIRVLEPQVFRFRENYTFFYLLGMSCLHQGDYGGAFSYLRRAVDLKENDINVLLGLAAVYLKRGDTGNALRIWLDILDLDPANVQAQRGLNYLKKNNDPDEFTSFSANDKILRFLPQVKKIKRFRPVLVILPVVLVLIVLLFILPRPRQFIFYSLSETFFQKQNRPGIEKVILDDRKDFLNLNSEYSIILTEKQVEKLFKDIQDELYEYRDNLAQRNINTLLLSNASEYIKDRARLLERYVEKPELTKFKDNFEFSEVSAQPELYRNCFVLWKGKATNLEETSEAISFDFLVGYHEEKNLDGIVPVKFNFTIKIIPDQPIEVLGRIITDDTNQFYLEGISVHRL